MPVKPDHTCFVMAPIGEPGSSVRQLSDGVLRDIIHPAVEGTGCTVVRADQILATGHINTQILEYITNAPLAVADLTRLNPNVMYELAIRHASGKTVCQIAEKGTVLPFDILGMRTTFFDLTDADSISSARAELRGLLAHCLLEPRAYGFPLTSGEFSGPLTDQQTRNLVHLHLASSAFRIYRVIDETVSDLEDGSKPFDQEDFVIAVRNALMESRRLCASFESRRLGSITEIFERTYSVTELRKSIERALRILLNADLDANAKRKNLLAYLQNEQLTMDARFDAILRTGHLPEPNGPSILGI